MSGLWKHFIWVHVVIHSVFDIFTGFFKATPKRQLLCRCSPLSPHFKRVSQSYAIVDNTPAFALKGRSCLSGLNCLKFPLTWLSTSLVHCQMKSSSLYVASFQDSFLCLSFALVECLLVHPSSPFLIFVFGCSFPALSSLHCMLTGA